MKARGYLAYGRFEDTRKPTEEESRGVTGPERVMSRRWEKQHCDVRDEQRFRANASVAVLRVTDSPTSPCRHTSTAMILCHDETPYLCSFPSSLNLRAR